MSVQGVFHGIRARVRPAGAGARGAGRLAGGARAAVAAALARRARATPLAPWGQRRGPAHRSHRARQPAVQCCGETHTYQRK